MEHGQKKRQEKLHEYQYQYRVILGIVHLVARVTLTQPGISHLSESLSFTELLLSGRAHPQLVWIPEATALAPWHEHPMETRKGWEKPYSNVLTTDTDWSDHIFYFVYLLTFYLFLSFMPLPFILKMFPVLVCIFVNGHWLVSEVFISEPVLWQLYHIHPKGCVKHNKETQEITGAAPQVHNLSTLQTTK